MENGKDKPMTAKIIGVVFIVAGCGLAGFLLSASKKHEIRTLGNFLTSVEQMSCELQFRLTPLPELCRFLASSATGCIQVYYLKLAEALESHIYPDAEKCALSALNNCVNIPITTRKVIENFANTLGRYDVDGQLLGLEAVHQEGTQKLSKLTENLDGRTRCYQTLGICSGFVVAILLV